MLKGGLILRFFDLEKMLYYAGVVLGAVSY
jgi:hypothetical protein